MANSDPARRLWMRYEARGIPDGLTLDGSGNLFGTGPAGVWIISPQGKALGRVELPEVPANAAWGEGGRRLYTTARTSVYRVRLRATGTVVP